MNGWDALEVMDVVNNNGGFHTYQTTSRYDKGWYLLEAYKATKFVIKRQADYRRFEREA